MDMQYYFSYNKQIKNILLRVLNNDDNKSLNSAINIICENKTIYIMEEIQVINIEKCNGEFIITGNNSLIHFYLPLTLNDSYIVIENKNSFELSNIHQFFFRS